ncbi:hypothetical protein [Streptomyces sp. cg36]|uniref:hypothetical protein n=1 Tax=Streptomyces sp. cg36 TaxID=3238798 RepID=UPI0034E25877
MAVFGLDIGQAADYAALTVVVPEGARPVGHRPKLAVVHVERIPLGVAYADMAGHVVEAARQYVAAGHPAVICADRTGIGRAVVEQLQQASAEDQIAVLGLTWTGGKNVTGEWPLINVPRQHIVNALAVALEQRALRILPGLQDRDALARELTQHQHGDHLGDLAASLAMAVWTADHLAATARWLTHNHPDPPESRT